jgi:dihydroorotase
MKFFNDSFSKNGFSNGNINDIKDKDIASNIIIKNGTLINTENNSKEKVDILIERGVITRIGSDIDMGASVRQNFLEINATDLFICPGFFDMHVHLREPGNEEEENIKSGIRSALRGGVTALACMPNTKPVLDDPYLIKYIKLAAIANNFNIFPIASMTKNIAGEKIAELGLLKEAGAIAFSDDGHCVQNDKLMYEIMKYATDMDLLLILHEEDYDFSETGLAHEGYYSSFLGLDGISSFSEDLFVARDIMFAKKTDARIHITHVSSKNAVELIRKAKEEGVKVTCDVTPEHMFFNDSCIKDYDTNFKIKPPIRSEEDRKAIIDGIKDGTIDAIASDHAPHLDIEKQVSFKEAAFGSIGLETIFKASFTKLCCEEGVSLEKLVCLISKNPAKILNTNLGSIKENELANISIVDLNLEDTYKKDLIVSKSKNSAFIGINLKGEIIYTISNGRLMYSNK